MDNKVGNEEITAFLESVQKESRTIVKAHVNVCAFGYPQEMKEIKAKVSSALASMGVTATYNIFDTPRSHTWTKFNATLFNNRNFICF